VLAITNARASWVSSNFCMVYLLPIPIPTRANTPATPACEAPTRRDSGTFFFCPSDSARKLWPARSAQPAASIAAAWETKNQTNRTARSTATMARLLRLHIVIKLPFDVVDDEP